MIVSLIIKVQFLSKSNRNPLFKINMKMNIEQAPLAVGRWFLIIFGGKCKLINSMHIIAIIRSIELVMYQDQLRQKRQQFVQVIRKTNREEIFKLSRKKQNNCESNQMRDAKDLIILDQRFRQIVAIAMEAQFNPIDLLTYCKSLFNEDINIKMQSLISIRRIISKQQSKETIQQVIDCGLVPELIKMLKLKEYPQFQLEACWIITNIASGSSSQCESIVQKGCIEVLIDLLYQNQPFIVDQALWGLGNIAGDCAKFRDIILSKGGIECLIRIVEGTKNVNVVRQGVWALSNLCRGAPTPKYDIIKPAIPLLARAIINNVLVGDELFDALWALVNNSQGNKSRVQRIIQVPGFVAKLIALCQSPSLKILVPSLRILGNISTGNENQTNTILQNSGLQLLQTLLSYERMSVRRQVCWIISNICAGTKNQVAAVLKHKQLVYKLVVCLNQDEEDVRKQICYIFANMCHLGDSQVVYCALREFKIVETIINMIQSTRDSKILQIALASLQDFLTIGQKISNPNPFILLMEMTPGCYENLQNLQHHQSSQIYRRVVKLFQRFFQLEDNVIF